jgi:hypothetical protein
VRFKPHRLVAFRFGIYHRDVQREEENDMKLTTMCGLVVLAWAFAAGAAEPQDGAQPASFSFDKDAPGKKPPGFVLARTKNLGKPGKWVVEAQKDAPSGGQALGQIDNDDTNARYPVAVTTAAFPSDVKVSVKCKAVSGDTDQACGLVFRYKDENNYYITRSNVLEENVRLYHVKDGKRTQFASWDGKVPGKVWNELTAEAKGDTFRVYFNGQKVIEAKDSTFSAGGKVGLWTKADSVTYFDDLTVSPL